MVSGVHFDTDGVCSFKEMFLALVKKGYGHDVNIKLGCIIIFEICDTMVCWSLQVQFVIYHPNFYPFKSTKLILNIYVEDFYDENKHVFLFHMNSWY